MATPDRWLSTGPASGNTISWQGKDAHGSGKVRLLAPLLRGVATRPGAKRRSETVKLFTSTRCFRWGIPCAFSPVFRSAVIIDIKWQCTYDAMMRTTITIDDSLAERIEELRRRRGISLKKVINSLLRDGLEHQSNPRPPRRFRTRTHRLGLRPGFDPARLNQLADELASDAFVAQELRRGR